MKRLTLKLLAMALSCTMLLAFGVHAVSATPKKLVVSVTNSTDAPIFLAFAARSEGEYSANAFVRGWFRIESGQSKAITAGPWSPMCVYYFYAENRSKNRYWGGKGKPGSASFPVHPTNAFKIRPDSNPPGYKRVFFRHLNENMGKANLRFK